LTTPSQYNRQPCLADFRTNLHGQGLFVQRMFSVAVSVEHSNYADLAMAQYDLLCDNLAAPESVTSVAYRSDYLERGAVAASLRITVAVAVD